MTPRASCSLGVLVAVSSALGCEDDRASLDLDAIVEPQIECVTVVHERLELGGPLHAFVGDRLGSPGGWGLITLDEGDNHGLALVRVPASSSEAPTPPVELGLPPEYADEVELRIGSAAGELWALSHAGDVSLRRLLPGLGELARNDSLANFPVVSSGGDGCLGKHTRMLLLFGGAPYLLALPECADGPALTLDLLELDRDTLSFGTSWQLAFDPCSPSDDPATCGLLHAYRIAGLGPGSSSPFPNAERVAVGFTELREFGSLYDAGSGGWVRTSDVSLLDMRMTVAGPRARMVTFTSVWLHGVPISLGRVALAQDLYSTQLHVRNELLDDDAALLRFDTIGDSYTLVTVPELLPFAGRGSLVQLGNQGAMLELDDGILRGVPLLDVDEWPFWTTYELLEREDLLDFELAGVGQLLLRREQAPPQLVHVSCLN